MYEWETNPELLGATYSLLPADEQQAILAAFKLGREQMAIFKRERDRAKDVLMTIHPITAGSVKVTATLPKVEVVDMARIPKLTVAEKILAENAPCEGCTGDCQKSRNRYWLVADIDELGMETVCRCKFGKQRDLAKKFRSSRIPDRYVGKTFSDYKVDSSNREAVTFAKNALKLKIGAYFFGECGTGKTFLASIIAQDFLKSGKSVLFVKVPSLLDDIKATFDGRGNELDLLDELQAANLVVLDDFGMEKSTQWAGSTLCKILDMRYDNPTGRTIVTSNLSIDELAAHLNHASDGANLNGSRIADRLREICKPILLKGTTRRN